MLKRGTFLKPSLLAVSVMIFSGTAVHAAEQTVYPLSVAVGRAYATNWSDDYYVALSEVEYPAVYLMNGCETMYPALSSTMDDINAYRLENATNMYDELLSYVNEDLSAGSADYWVPYSSKDKVKVRRADSTVCSLLFEGSSYTGGAHGNYWAKGENYDTQTGQLLFITDVVSDPTGFVEVVQEQVNSLWAGSALFSDTAVSEYFANTQEIDLSWTLDYNGITVYFNPYEIAPYASGIINVTIPFAEYPWLFYGNYQEVPDSYAITLSEAQSFFYDVDNDGYLDNIYITDYPTDDGGYDQQIIYVNGMEYDFSAYFFSMEPVLVHLANGTNYLYIETAAENDYRETTVYDLSQGDVQQLSVFGAALHTYPDYDAYITKDAFTDPNGLILEERSHMLGTCTANRYYHIGDDGLPVADEEYYALKYYTDLCLKQPLDVDLLDDYGNVYETVTLETGSYVRPVRTDMVSFVDLMMEDGGYCRVYVDASSWPQLVNGVDVMEVFDGIIFAG